MALSPYPVDLKPLCRLEAFSLEISHLLSEASKHITCGRDHVYTKYLVRQFHAPAAQCSRLIAHSHSRVYLCSTTFNSKSLGFKNSTLVGLPGSDRPLRD